MNIIFLSGTVSTMPRYLRRNDGTINKDKAIFVVVSLRQSESVSADRRERYDVFTCVTTNPAQSAQLVEQITHEGMSIQIVGSVAQNPVFQPDSKRIERVKSIVIIHSFDVLSTDEREKLMEYEAIMRKREKARERRLADKAGRELSELLGGDGYA